MFVSEVDSPLSRRRMMEYAACSMLGVSIGSGISPHWTMAQTGKPGAGGDPSSKSKPVSTRVAGKQSAAPARHVIFLYMAGAMTHLDTFDLKPGIAGQGETKGISTSIPGMQFGETLPELAKLANHLAVIRTMTTQTGDHEQGRYLLRTSYKEIATIRHPTLGAWGLKVLGRLNKTLPDNVLVNGDARHPGAGFLEPALTPVPIADPNAGLQNTVTPKYLTNESFEKRLQLINRFDASFRKKFPQKQVEAYNEFYSQATQLMHSQELKAFDLSQEKPEIRDQYGRDRFGQGCLLARRLVEHDVRFIEVVLDGWDMHTDIYQQDKLPAKAALMDKAVSNLLRDLQTRGLLSKTLVVLSTEFGRTPTINQNGGRDHHPGVFSSFLAGGSIKGGHFYGKSDKEGFRPDEDAVAVADFNATIALAMGLPLDEEFYSKSGRPFKVAHDGKPLMKLFS